VRELGSSLSRGFGGIGGAWAGHVVLAGGIGRGMGPHVRKAACPPEPRGAPAVCDDPYSKDSVRCTDQLFRVLTPFDCRVARSKCDPGRNAKN
jgi:hypothetical protein